MRPIRCYCFSFTIRVPYDVLEIGQLNDNCSSWSEVIDQFQRVKIFYFQEIDLAIQSAPLCFMKFAMVDFSAVLAPQDSHHDSFRETIIAKAALVSSYLAIVRCYLKKNKNTNVQ